MEPPTGRIYRTWWYQSIVPHLGIIVIDKDGRCSSGLQQKMIHSWIEPGGKAYCAF